MAEYEHVGPVRAPESSLAPGWYSLRAGSPGWGLNRLRSLVLPAIVAELAACVERPMPLDLARNIAIAGKRLLDLRPASAGAPLLAAAWQQFVGFAAALRAWPEFQGNAHDRWAVAFRAADERRQFSHYLRRYQGAIAANVDWDFLERALETLEQLTVRSEGRLPKLETALRRFHRARRIATARATALDARGEAAERVPQTMPAEMPAVEHAEASEGVASGW
jgi:hypothetical protein